MSARKVALPKKSRPVSVGPTAFSVLQRIGAGEALIGRRDFPFPYEAGRALLKDGPPAADLSQLDWVEGVA